MTGPRTPSRSRNRSVLARDEGDGERTVPKVKVSYFHVCMHCEEAPCTAGLPGRGRHLHSGTMDSSSSIPRSAPAAALRGELPLDVLFFNDASTSPRSARVAPICSTTAGQRPAVSMPVPPTPCASARRGTGRVDRSSERTAPNSVSRTRVYYLNMPKRFIGGTLFDPAADEVIIGARARSRTTERRDLHHRDRRLRRPVVQGPRDDRASR